MRLSCRFQIIFSGAAQSWLGLFCCSSTIRTLLHLNASGHNSEHLQYLFGSAACVCQCLSAALACQQTHFSTSVRIHHSRLEVILSVFWHHTKETLIKHHGVFILNLTFVSVYLRLNFYSQPVACRGVYLDKTPFLLYLGPLHWMSWLPFWQGLFTH